MVVIEASAEESFLAPAALVARWQDKPIGRALHLDVRGVRLALALLDPPWRRAAERLCDHVEQVILAPSPAFRGRLSLAWPLAGPES
jgi:hypothetical protein